jgi:predicted DNA-binding transcriptional regulator AlpA
MSLPFRPDRVLSLRGTAVQPLPEYVDVKGLEAYTGVSASTWNKRRLTGDTPPFIKIGKSVRYHLPTVKEWMATRVQRSTSDAAPLGNGGAHNSE